MAVFNRDLFERLPYPPASDQIMYLAGGELFADRLQFFWRSPLYGLWMGVFYILSGRNPEICFYLEKYVSTFLLGLAVAWLGLRLCDLSAGLLMGVWILNCKYILLESNGSHIIAAVLFSISLLSLTFANRNARLPVALLALLLSTQARSEMWIPLIFVLFTISFLAARKWMGRKRFAVAIFGESKRYWIAAAAVGAVFFLLFNIRMGPTEPHRLSEAFAMNFAMNYVDRLNTPKADQSEQFDWMRVWVSALPGVSASAEAVREDRGEIHVIKAIKKYPKKMLAHVGYNLKLFVRALPASFLAFDRPRLMLISFVIYLSSLYLSRSIFHSVGKWDEMPSEERLLIAVWALAILTLIPISLVLRVVARYYIQLAPVLIAVSVIIANCIWMRLSAYRRVRTYS